MPTKNLQPELLPYPLPPWVHRFRTLSIFCEVDEQVLAERIMQPLEERAVRRGVRQEQRRLSRAHAQQQMEAAAND